MVSVQRLADESINSILYVRAVGREGNIDASEDLCITLRFLLSLPWAALLSALKHSVSDFS